MVWVVSFVFGILGVAVLWLFVENPVSVIRTVEPSVPVSETLDFQAETVSGSNLLAGSCAVNRDDERWFFYLLLNERGGISSKRFFPLLYVITACWYMLLSIPVGVVADRRRRATVLLSGMEFCAACMWSCSRRAVLSLLSCMAALFFLGLYYAATEGVLMAMASSVIPASLRASGLAMLVTFINLGKFVSSLLFGWLYGAYTGRPYPSRCLR